MNLNYLKVPDSNVKLTDGSVVMLSRFPGTKWVVHNGWYNYAGKRYMGWYFCSIPAQTIIPVNGQDLTLLTVITDDDSNIDSIPAPGVIDTPDGMPGHWGPVHPDHHHHHPHPPFPPAPPYPPVPPQPEPDGPSFFSQSKNEMLSETFISVPNIKQRDALADYFVKDGIPDGKIVRVNSADGEVKYYKWSSYNDRWEDWKDEFLSDISSDIGQMQQEISDLSELVESRDTSLDERVDALESSVYDIKDIDITSQNTILVSHEGTMKDSGYSIGDDEIGEPSEYANSNTLATEKAVARKVEESATTWHEF